MRIVTVRFETKHALSNSEYEDLLHEIGIDRIVRVKMDFSHKRFTMELVA
jgi:hypothetical protein